MTEIAIKFFSDFVARFCYRSFAKSNNGFFLIYPMWIYCIFLSAHMGRKLAIATAVVIVGALLVLYYYRRSAGTKDFEAVKSLYRPLGGSKHGQRYSNRRATLQDCGMKCAGILEVCQGNAFTREDTCRKNCLDVVHPGCMAKCPPQPEGNECINRCTPVLDQCIRQCAAVRAGGDSVCSGDYDKCNRMCK